MMMMMTMMLMMTCIDLCGKTFKTITRAWGGGHVCSLPWGREHACSLPWGRGHACSLPFPPICDDDVSVTVSAASRRLWGRLWSRCPLKACWQIARLCPKSMTTAPTAYVTRSPSALTPRSAAIRPSRGLVFGVTSPKRLARRLAPSIPHVCRKGHWDTMTMGRCPIRHICRMGHWDTWTAWVPIYAPGLGIEL